VGVLAVYDTVGIQNYIFGSNKLAENVGGSKLVADVFRDVLPGIMRRFEPSLPEWRDGGPLRPGARAEIIYQGGGNAYAAFADGDTFQAATKAFLIEVNKAAPGIGIAAAALETDFGDTYKSDFEKLNKRLIIVKGGFNAPVLDRSQPITKQSGRTGLPVSARDGDEFLSESQVRKRERYRDYCERERKSDLRDFDELAWEKGSDSLIAIVHADGNNMGKRIKEFMGQERFRDYAGAVPEIRRLSVAIDDCYRSAREDTVAAFRSAYADYITAREGESSGKTRHSKTPILEIIGDGDDTTLVLGGHFAIDFAARLLREIEGRPDPFGRGERLTACAGAVIFHSHYPFSEAYKLAEELCASAKKPSREREGSYIDFHLHQSGNVAGLRQLRERQYTVDGKTILRRPWRVSAGGEADCPSFRWFEESVGEIKGISRNKTKAIRNAIGAGDGAARLAINRLRGKKPPEFPLGPERDREGNVGMSEYAPLFDILDVYDTCENLLSQESAGAANVGKENAGKASAGTGGNGQ
jgi:hypothetical protein